MPKRSEKRDAAMAEYCKRRAAGKEINLRALAEEQDVSYDLLRRWKSQDRWDEAGTRKRAGGEAPRKRGGGEAPRKRGGQPGNGNSRGKKNAKGHHDGAPAGNKNAEKDGAYSAIFFDALTDAERELVAATPTDSDTAMRHEMQILKLREKKILDKIARYEAAPEDELYVGSLLDMRAPAGRGENKRDGAQQTMGMYSKESPFNRVLKLQEALYKVQGRIAAIANSLRAAEENRERVALEKERLEIMRMRATGAVEVPEPEEADEKEWEV